LECYGDIMTPSEPWIDAMLAKIRRRPGFIHEISLRSPHGLPRMPLVVFKDYKDIPLGINYLYWSHLAFDKARVPASTNSKARVGKHNAIRRPWRRENK
jgi:hypothetical protein